MSKYHDILGIEPNASKDDIKKAYRKMAGRYHPDKGGDTVKFQEIQEAYERLTNPEKFQQEQAHYRQYTGDPFQGGWGVHGAPHDVRSAFEEILRRHHQQQRQPTVKLHLELELESTLHNQTKTIHVPEYNIPPFEITIPAGIRHGEVIQYSQVPTSNPNQQHINLQIVFMYRPHKDFEIIDNVHLVKYETIDAFNAMIGTSIDITTLEGKTLSVKVPAHTQNGQKLKIPSHGLKYKENPNIRGDLYVEVLITVPYLTDDEKEIIEDLLKKRTK